MRRRNFLGFLGVLAGAVFFPFRAARALSRWPVGTGLPAPPLQVTTLTFGSCLLQDQPQPIWNAIQASGAELFAFLGDNVYADTEDMGKMREAYATLGARPEFGMFRARVPIVATWDDHDYAFDDAGGDFPKKEESKQIFLDFFGEPAGSARRKRAGVYTSFVYGEAPRRLQVILLDLRSFRTAMKWNDEGGQYRPDTSPGASLLGTEQWAWLEAQLKFPADLRVLCSSVQLVASEHGWEKWANFPLEKAKLYALLDDLNVRNLCVISGDMHFAELSRETTPGGIPVLDLTASGMNRKEDLSWLANSKRLLYRDNVHHFGAVAIDWGQGGDAPVRVRFEIRDEEGARLFFHTAEFPRG